MFEKVSFQRIILLVLALTVVETGYRLLTTGSFNATMLVMSLFRGAVLGLFLAWLVPKLGLDRIHLFGVMWFSLFIVGYFNNMIEGYFFTSVFPSFGTFLVGLGVTLIITCPEAGATALLIQSGEGSLARELTKYFAERGGRSWVIRIAAASLVYFPIYFFFGMLVSPFIMPYYSDPSLGLIVPPLTTIIPLEFFRGFLYVASLLPLVAALKPDSGTVFLVISGMLYIPGAFIPLIVETSLPAPIIPFHLVEILADSMVYGYVLTRILGHPSGTRGAGP